MRYLIIGAGGVGGTLAGFLHDAGKDVTCIAHGEHLAAIQEQGLTLHSDRLGRDVVARVPACTVEEYVRRARTLTDDERPDAILVAVKGYSLESVVPAIQAAAGRKTLVIPLINFYGTGQLMRRWFDNVVVIEGCIYVNAYREADGVVRQLGRVLRVVYGALVEQRIPASRLEQLAMDMRSAGIKVTVSTDIRSDTFIKWGFISAWASTCAYHSCTVAPLQSPGVERDTFIALVRESYAVGRAIGLDLPCDYMLHSLNLIDHMAPTTTTSLQRDIAAMHQSEIQGQLFAMARLGHRCQVEVPTYDRICERFRQFDNEGEAPASAAR